MKNEFLNELLSRYPILNPCMSDIESCCDMLVETVKSNGKILLCGNGGSASDCEHISGELLKGFLKERPLCEQDLNKFNIIPDGQTLGRTLQYGIPAIPLTSFSSVFTAFCNDVDPDAVFAQLVLALGKPGDCLICISTSGNAKNVYNSAVTAKAFGVKVIGLTGKNGGILADLCDICIKVPETETFKAQELHLPIYHCICAVLEDKICK